MTAHEYLKEQIGCTKKLLKELDIDPNKDWDLLTLGELADVANHFEMSISDIV